MKPSMVVLEVLEVDESGWEPRPLTVDERIARSVEGFDPTLSGAQDVFEWKAPA